MTKQEFYLHLCIEAGTYDGTTDADQWYEDCGHNITSGMDEDFTLAAEGDVQAVADARTSVGLPIFV